MHRFVSISWVSLAVIVVAVGVMAAQPGVRSVLVSARMQEEALQHPASLVREQARERPRDAQVWLALAVAPDSLTAESEPDLKALERAIELQPKWAAPYLVLGSALASAVPMVSRAELAAFNPRFATEGKRRRATLTRNERQTIRRAQAALLQARTLDPRNAAPDYLLAFLALSERRDDEALARLRSALGKDGWSLGRKEATVAVYEAARPSMPAFQADVVAMLALSTVGSASNLRLRELARVATGMSMLARQAGDHQRAIFLRETVMHLGGVMMGHAYTVIDAMGGTSIWSIGTGERLTPAERMAATKGIPPNDRERYNRALTQAKHAKLTPYLRAHGRGNLADAIARFDRSYPSWLAKMRKAVRSLGRLGTFWWAVGILAMLFAAQGAALAWLAVSGLAWIVLAVARRRPTPVTWARWKWAAVVAICFGLPAAVALALSHKWTAPFVVAESGGEPWGLTAVVLGLGLLLIVTPFITWRVRRGVEVSARPGYFRQFVGTLTAVVLPVAAIIVVALTPSAVRVGVQAQQSLAQFKVLIYEGELAYYGLQRPLVGTAGSRGKILQSPGAPSE